MDYTDYFLDKVNRFAIGKLNDENKYYVAIPVSNMVVDYMEYYEINKEMLDSFLGEPAKALSFVERCRNREMDELLIFKPGRDRGEPA
ncbi:hypothetical protein [Neisseria sp. Ec49-e6-T10]|uniref:hypothetical protein n=1 Tax=Neisseria sp. Ec49-e6-T10 TaxID=3140744 RepID=UPI003EBC3A5E